MRSCPATRCRVPSSNLIFRKKPFSRCCSMPVSSPLTSLMGPYGTPKKYQVIRVHNAVQLPCLLREVAKVVQGYTLGKRVQVSSTAPISSILLPISRAVSTGDGSSVRASPPPYPPPHRWRYWALDFSCSVSLVATRSNTSRPSNPEPAHRVTSG
jgi:hypothetical protein